VEIVIVTSSVDAVQGLLLMVHRNVTLEPTDKPVTALAGDVGDVIVAEPLTTLHIPVPTVGVLPAKVVAVTLHKF